MSKLNVKVTHEVKFLQDTILCPECGGKAKMHTNEDSFHLECLECGVQGYRYELPSLAIKDFPHHHGLPKRKAS